MRTRIWHSDWKPRWLIRCVSAALLSFMDKQEAVRRLIGRYGLLAISAVEKGLVPAVLLAGRQRLTL